jgi:hypothetical protein
MFSRTMGVLRGGWRSLERRLEVLGEELKK